MEYLLLLPIQLFAIYKLMDWAFKAGIEEGKRPEKEKHT